MQSFTLHALEQLASRCTPQETASIAKVAVDYIRQHPTGDHAVRVGTLHNVRGTAWSVESNGDTVWAIVRNGRVVTVLLRRSTQPATPEAFGVTTVRS